jgi:hypothetical protein
MIRWCPTATAFAASAALLSVAAPLPAQRGSTNRLTLGGQPPPITSEANLRGFLDELESQEFGLGTALGLEQYYQWRGEATNRATENARLLNDVFNRADYAAVVDAGRGKVADSLLARRLELRHLNFLQAKANPVQVVAYSDLHADLNALYRDSYRRFVGVELPPADYVSNVDMLATGPLYFQSYLYADMIAAQLRSAMVEQFHTDDLSRDPRVAQWMIQNVFADGGLVPWATKVLRATGRPTSVDALVDYLTKD